MDKSLSPSWLAAKASGFPLEADTVAEHDENCLFCGCDIKEGEPCNTAKIGRNFNDWPYVAKEDSDYLCQACKTLSQKIFLQKYSKSLITTEGFFGLAKADEQAQFLLDPPKPPFVVILSNQQQQHLIWKATVSLCSDHPVIRYGDREMMVDRKKVLQSAEDINALKAITEEHLLQKNNKKTTVYSIFSSNDNELKSEEFGVIKSYVFEACINNEKAQQLINNILGLNILEIWLANRMSNYIGSKPSKTPLPLTKNLPAQ